jgi:hypothetical protein
MRSGTRAFVVLGSRQKKKYESSMFPSGKANTIGDTRATGIEEVYQARDGGATSSTTAVFAPPSFLKKGIVLRFSGVGPCASSFFLARSVCKSSDPVGTVERQLNAQLQNLPFLAQGPQVKCTPCTTRYLTCIHTYCRSLESTKLMTRGEIENIKYTR